MAGVIAYLQSAALHHERVDLPLFAPCDRVVPPRSVPLRQLRCVRPPVRGPGLTGPVHACCLAAEAAGSVRVEARAQKTPRQVPVPFMRSPLFHGQARARQPAFCASARLAHACTHTYIRPLSAPDLLACVPTRTSFSQPHGSSPCNGTRTRARTATAARKLNPKP